MRFLAEVAVTGLDGPGPSWCEGFIADGQRASRRNEPSATLTIHVEAGDDGPEPLASSAEAMLARVRASVTSGNVRIDGQSPAQLMLAAAEFAYFPDGRVQRAHFELEASLDEPVPFPFTPGRTAAELPGEMSFEAARLAAQEAAPLLFIPSRIVETARYWFFPVREIGTRGVIVDRRSGEPFLVGSAFSSEVWIWAWEQGLTSANAWEVVDCTAPDAFVAGLKHVYRLGPSAFRNLPVKLKADWRAYGALYELRELIQVRPTPKPDAPPPAHQGD